MGLWWANFNTDFPSKNSWQMKVPQWWYQAGPCGAPGHKSLSVSPIFFFNFLIYYLFIIFIFGCVGSSFLCEGFLQLRRVGATLHRGARASHCCGLSCCGAQAPDAQAQQLWLTGPAAPRHVGSSQTRARTRVPCIGRQTLNHCATRKAPLFLDYRKLPSFSLHDLPWVPRGRFKQLLIREGRGCGDKGGTVKKTII